MPLFRPYQRPDKSTADDASTKKPVADPALVRTTTKETPVANTVAATPSEGLASATSISDAPQKKAQPTPTRKQAEAARRERLHPTYTKKELKLKNRENNRNMRAKLMEAEDNRPEKILLRNFVDSKWHVAEFMMPVMLIILAIFFGIQFRTSFAVQLLWILNVVNYLVLGLMAFVVLDVTLTWIKFRKLLEQRYPGTPRRGLFVYLVNRMISIRRFRIPGPAIKRGDQV